MSESPPTAAGTILDLCCGTGSWSEPYRTRGYRVVRVDAEARTAADVVCDVRAFTPAEPIHGVLAAPPCTAFAASGWNRRIQRGRAFLAAAIEVVDACLRIVRESTPMWWALENPVGYLGTYLGPPTLLFQPYEYGDPWKKRTCVWGAFALPTKRPVVPNRSIRLEGFGRAWRAQRRSVTPAGFAEAFCLANP